VFSFTVYGNAVAKGSTRAFPLMKDGKPVLGKGGRPVTITTGDNPKTKDWQLLVSKAAQEYGPEELLDGPVCMELFFYLQRPKSLTPKKRPYPTVKPDLDKLIRSIGDGLKGIIYSEDARIVKIVAAKYYTEFGDTPRVEVKVGEFGADTSTAL
jgi:Holliday junction resolvase RusA-like endonuclease